jgi:hypothetical protein
MAWTWSVEMYNEGRRNVVGLEIKKRGKNGTAKISVTVVF